MATMTDSTLLVQFANACKAQVHVPWTTLADGAARARKVHEITCAVLDVCRVPRPTLELTHELGGASGQFDFTTTSTAGVVNPNGGDASIAACSGNVSGLTTNCGAGGAGTPVLYTGTAGIPLSGSGPADVNGGP